MQDIHAVVDYSVGRRKAERKNVEREKYRKKNVERKISKRKNVENRKDRKKRRLLNEGSNSLLFIVVDLIIPLV